MDAALSNFCAIGQPMGWRLMAEFTVAEQMQMTEGMTDQQKFLFQTQFAAVRKDRVMIFLVSFFLGALGIDRFLLGDIGLGLLKLLTAGVLGIFWFIDLFLIMGRTDDYNRAKAYQIASYIRASGPAI
jgi:TM2 domain-containing membrane protein YozV